MASEPLMQNPPQTPAPTNIEQAKAQGLAVAGTQLLAPLSPKSGPIPGKSGDLVVGVLKDFWESKTVIAAKRIIVSALLAVVAVILAQCGLAWTAGKSLLDPGAIDWRLTERLAEIAAGGIISSAFFAWYKKRDNDPVKEG